MEASQGDINSALWYGERYLHCHEGERAIEQPVGKVPGLGPRGVGQGDINSALWKGERYSRCCDGDRDVEQPVGKVPGVGPGGHVLCWGEGDAGGPAHRVQGPGVQLDEDIGHRAAGG